MSCNEWREVKLKDEIELLYGKSLPKTKRNESGNVVVYGSNGPIGFHDEALINSPGVIIGRKGTVGAIHFSPKPFFPIDTTYYLNPKNNDLKFMYYFLQRLGLNEMNSHSAVPGLNRDSVYELVVNLPPLKEQKAIAKILSDLDEKIEINNRINKVLEEMAQAIFKRWFVDFEFPNENGEPYKSSGGEMVESELGFIPKGWEVVSLDKIAVYTNGLAMQKFRPKEGEESFPVLKIKELRQGFADKSSELCSKNIENIYIIEDGDVIFSWSGSLLVDIWAGGKCGLNQHLFKVTSNKYNKWFYYLWTKYYLEKFTLIANDKATTMGHIKRTDLSNAKVLIPKKEEYTKINELLEPIIQLLTENKIKNQTLSNLRDTLLPKLMSGEIRVPLD